MGSAFHTNEFDLEDERRVWRDFATRAAFTVDERADAAITQFARMNASVIAAMNKARALVRYGVDEVAEHTHAYVLGLTAVGSLLSRLAHRGRPEPGQASGGERV